jgi:hypothetical protein
MLKYDQMPTSGGVLFGENPPGGNPAGVAIADAYFARNRGVDPSLSFVDAEELPYGQQIKVAEGIATLPLVRDETDQITFLA